MPTHTTSANNDTLIFATLARGKALGAIHSIPGTSPRYDEAGHSLAEDDGTGNVVPSLIRSGSRWRLIEPNHDAGEGVQHARNPGSNGCPRMLGRERVRVER